MDSIEWETLKAAAGAFIRGREMRRVGSSV
uniref:Uncharacterized protein n=1 Tax=Rhizophora mucronata TaxID=61149 RepID=A0A2P2KP35_RHIMU